MNQQQTILLGSQPGDAADRNDGAVVFALALLAFGSLMAVAGVYLLFGTGWALIRSSPKRRASFFLHDKHLT